MLTTLKCRLFRNPPALVKLAMTPIGGFWSFGLGMAVRFIRIQISQEVNGANLYQPIHLADGIINTLRANTNTREFTREYVLEYIYK